MNVLPRFSPGLVARTVPPCISASFLTIERPRPSCLRVVDASAWGSVTVISTGELTRSSSTWIRPLLGANFTALDRGFQTTCCNRAGSPVTGPASESNILRILTPLASAAGITVVGQQAGHIVAHVRVVVGQEDSRPIDPRWDQAGLDRRGEAGIIGVDPLGR
jgi:hypothetical protein